MHTLAATETHGYISTTVEIRSRVYYVELVILALIEWTNAKGSSLFSAHTPSAASQQNVWLSFISGLVLTMIIS